MAKNIILCVDGSPYAEYAFDWYCSNFYREGHNLVLLHVPESFVNVSMMSPARHLECQREADQNAKELQQSFLKKAQEKNVRAEFVRCDCEEKESTGAAIIRAANKLDPLFIVTGTRGQGKIRRTILGSVSDYLVHHSTVPVLVARHKDQKH